MRVSRNVQMVSLRLFSLCFLISVPCFVTRTSGKPYTGRNPGTVYYDTDGHHEIFPRDVRDGVSSRGDFIGSGNIIDWHEEGRRELERYQKMRENQRDAPAKNVIFFIGDGMGVSTISAARVYNAQNRQFEGLDVPLAFDKMDHAGLSMTYNTDRFVADSAGTATAFLCGEKARYGVICVNQHVQRGNCSAQAGNELTSILHKAVEAGKSTGVVTNTRITHATPSAAFAHSADRNWESAAPEGCRDMSSQLVEDEINQKVNIFMGGGRKMFMPNTTYDEEYPDEPGMRVDGRNLMEEWKDNMAEEGFDEDEAVFVQRQSEFDSIDIDKVQRILGLFNPDHMNYESDRDEDVWGEPSLAEMVEKSIQILSRDEDGFMLFVEGGRIDHAHHATNPFRALNETVSLSDAINVALETTDPDETLIVVSSDHSHVMSISGNPGISENILGSAHNSRYIAGYDEEFQYADDDQPFQTLSYANGPGYYVHRTANDSLTTEQRRLDLSEVDEALFQQKDWVQDAGIPLRSERHAGEEVAIYSHGVMSQLIHSTHQQSYIAHAILYATCIEGPDEMPHCDSQPSGQASRAIRKVELGIVHVAMTAILVRLLL